MTAFSQTCPCRSVSTREGQRWENLGYPSIPWWEYIRGTVSNAQVIWTQEDRPFVFFKLWQILWKVSNIGYRVYVSHARAIESFFSPSLIFLFLMMLRNTLLFAILEIFEPHFGRWQSCGGRQYFWAIWVRMWFEAVKLFVGGEWIQAKTCLDNF